MLVDKKKYVKYFLESHVSQKFHQNLYVLIEKALLWVEESSCPCDFLLLKLTQDMRTVWYIFCMYYPTDRSILQRPTLLLVEDNYPEASVSNFYVYF